MTSATTVVDAKGVGKQYPPSVSSASRLRAALRFRPAHSSDGFWAVRNVSFQVAAGETVGILGQNGSGKSTLLQLVAGTMRPTTGAIRTAGRIAALLELGAGFHPEFTGRENARLNAFILGLESEAIDDRLERIVEFSGIGEQIDRPVRTYSSGMFTRLAFSVAINVDPDLLIIDEALSVGDEAFQRKCMSRLRQLQERGTSILFVSHASSMVIELCDRAMLMDHGEVLLEGAPKSVVAQYHRLSFAPAATQPELRRSILAHVPDGDDDSPRAGMQQVVGIRAPTDEDIAEFDPALVPQSTVEYPKRGASITDIRLEDTLGRKVNVLLRGRTYRYCYRFTAATELEMLRFGMMIKNLTGIEIAGRVSHAEGGGLDRLRAGESVDVRFDFENRLLPGAYFMNAGVLARKDDEIFYADRIIDAFAFRVKYAPGETATGMVDMRTPGTDSGTSWQRAT